MQIILSLDFALSLKPGIVYFRKELLTTDTRNSMNTYKTW